MYLIYGWMWIVFVQVVHSDLSCPELAPKCTCGKAYDWIGNEWKMVTYANCSNSGLVQVPDLSSLYGKSVYRLSLNNNNITRIKSNHFVNITVQHLVLSKNPLKSIPENAFKEIRHKLERLDIDGVKLKIDTGLPFLKGMTKLKSVDLGYNLLKNKYKVFPSGLFASLNLTSLVSLTLQALQMSKLEEGAFNGIEGLEQLDLSYNFLPDFPKELLHLKKLKRLKLYSNEIMVLKNNTFSGLTKLQKILIGVNDIDTIEPGAFNDLEGSLEEINLYHNPLPAVPTEALSELRKLKKLSLVKNSLSEVKNGSFVGDYSLEELQIGDNPKLAFDDEGMFHGIEESLSTLFIRSLNLDSLPVHILSRLKRLEYLDATDNNIRKIDKRFFKGLNLSIVKLMKNRIKHIDHRAFRNFPKGVILDLHDNLIHNISFILEVEKCTFKEVYLTRNRIKCNCEVEKVLNSGLVSWDVIGDCYAEENLVKRWYNFKDPKLMDYFRRTCKMTKPFALCFQSTSSTSSVHVSLTNYFVLCAFMCCLRIFFTLNFWYIYIPSLLCADRWNGSYWFRCYYVICTVELQCLEHLWDHRKLFETWVVRAIEG